MDPLSVTASITGIVAVAAKITTTLAAFIDRDRNAPKSIRRVLTELSDLRICLDQLAPFIRGVKDAEESRKDGISVEQVVVISTSLVLNISELDKMLDSFRLDDTMSAIARLRWIKNEEKIDKILTHIRASKSSLSLILTIFTCASTQAAQSSILNLTSTVDQILQTSEDVSRRVASIETRYAIPSRYPDSMLRPAPKDDDTSTIISLAQDYWDHDTFAQSIRQNGDHEQSLSKLVDVASSSTPNGQIPYREQHPSSSVGRQGVLFDPSLESELYASRVYSRNTHRHSMSSALSTGNSTGGLSFLSGLSISQISSLSLFSLPIYCQELWNPQLYETSQHSGRSVSLVAQEPSKLIPLFQSIEKSSMSAEGIREIKVLLLVTLSPGAGESGKSTVYRQMKLLCEPGFTMEERRMFRDVFFDNILGAFRIVFEARREWGVDYESKNSLQHEQILHQYYRPCYGSANSHVRLDEPFPKNLLSPMKELFADEGFQRIVKKGNRIALNDNFQYFFKNIDSLFSPQYFPNDQEVLHTSMNTSGFLDVRLKFGKLDCVITDIGSTRSRREEWVHLFNGVNCVIFTAPLTGYNQRLVKEKSANQTEASLLLFDSILSLTSFKRSTIILLLSKLDLLQEKVFHSSVKDYFPDFNGADDDREAAQEFFVNKFLTIARKRCRNVRVYCTNLTDTDSFRPILKDIEASIRHDHNVDGEFIGQ
ncbi:G-protein alpha subunit-domain-containing protein [Usnea florida]